MNNFFEKSNINALCWKQIDKKEVLKTRVMTVTETSSISPKGNIGRFVVMDAPEWVIIIPELYVDGKKCFIIEEQWRHGINELCVEFPGGVVNNEEEPMMAAKRELLEETGYEALSILHLGSMSPNPAIMSNRVHFYLARDLKNTHKRNLDEDEFVRFFIEDAEKVLSNMGQPPFMHALMCAACHLYNQFSKKA
ncbi:MAG: NUDIX hydrolase [Treponema sp.]|nr:NUDIX hydrolase [Treponema sp.]